MATYYYSGHETVRSYIKRQLGSWECVKDIERADVVITYFTHATALEDAYFDEAGIIKQARKGTMLIDLTASTPALSREISAVAMVNDLRPVEAPLAVLEATAEDTFSSPENFVCYVSGEADDVSDAREVLDELAGLVKNTGTTGSAQLAKAMHTSQLCAQIMAVVEADALRRAVEASNATLKIQGNDIEPLSDIAAHALAAIEAQRFRGSYTVEMMMGDVAAAMTAADDVDLILPQLEAALHLLEVLAVIGGADMSPAALALVYRDEEASKREGLDWSRAEHLFVDDHDHHDHGELDDEYLDFDEYDDYDDGFGLGVGGFGRYSAN